MLLSCTDPEIFSGGWGLTDNLSFVGGRGGGGGGMRPILSIYLCEYSALIFGVIQTPPPSLDLSIVVVYI